MRGNCLRYLLTTRCAKICKNLYSIISGDCDDTDVRNDFDTVFENCDNIGAVNDVSTVLNDCKNAFNARDDIALSNDCDDIRAHLIVVTLSYIPHNQAI